jgi:hypothetical protein
VITFMVPHQTQISSTFGAQRCVGGLSRIISGSRLCAPGRDLRVEVKARADGFRELYSWLTDRDVLIVKADRQEALVVLGLSLAAEIANWSRDHVPPPDPNNPGRFSPHYPGGKAGWVRSRVRHVGLREGR